jgi:hypothetical protein
MRRVDRVAAREQGLLLIGLNAREGVAPERASGGADERLEGKRRTLARPKRLRDGERADT